MKKNKELKKKRRREKRLEAIELEKKLKEELQINDNKKLHEKSDEKLKQTVEMKNQVDENVKKV